MAAYPSCLGQLSENEGTQSPSGRPLCLSVYEEVVSD